MNFGKSALLAVWEVPNINMLVVDLGCRVGSLPTTYLGLLLGAFFKRLDVWNPIIETVHKRLAGWKANYLSKGGRLTLIKATLANIPLHDMSLLNMPKLIAQKIEKM